MASLQHCQSDCCPDCSCICLESDDTSKGIYLSFMSLHAYYDHRLLSSQPIPEAKAEAKAVAGAETKPEYDAKPADPDTKPDVEVNLAEAKLEDIPAANLQTEANAEPKSDAIPAEPDSKPETEAKHAETKAAEPDAKPEADAKLEVISEEKPEIKPECSAIAASLAGGGGGFGVSATVLPKSSDYLKQSERVHLGPGSMNNHYKGKGSSLYELFSDSSALCKSEVVGDYFVPFETTAQYLTPAATKAYGNGQSATDPRSSITVSPDDFNLIGCTIPGPVTFFLANGAISKSVAQASRPDKSSVSCPARPVRLGHTVLCGEVRILPCGRIILVEQVMVINGNEESEPLRSAFGGRIVVGGVTIANHQPGQGTEVVPVTSYAPVVVALSSLVPLETVPELFPDFKAGDLPVDLALATKCAEIFAAFLDKGKFDDNTLAKYCGFGRSVATALTSDFNRRKKAAKPPIPSVQPTPAGAKLKKARFGAGEGDASSNCSALVVAATPPAPLPKKSKIHAHGPGQGAVQGNWVSGFGNGNIPQYPYPYVGVPMFPPTPAVPTLELQQQLATVQAELAASRATEIARREAEVRYQALENRVRGEDKERLREISALQELRVREAHSNSQAISSSMLQQQYVTVATNLAIGGNTSFLASAFSVGGGAAAESAKPLGVIVADAACTATVTAIKELKEFRDSGLLDEDIFLGQMQIELSKLISSASVEKPKKLRVLADLKTSGYIDEETCKEAQRSLFLA